MFSLCEREVNVVCVYFLFCHIHFFFTSSCDDLFFVALYSFPVSYVLQLFNVPNEDYATVTMFLRKSTRLFFYCRLGPIVRHNRWTTGGWSTRFTTASDVDGGSGVGASSGMACWVPWLMAGRCVEGPFMIRITPSVLGPCISNRTFWKNP